MVSLHMELIYFQTAQNSNDRPAGARIAPFAIFSLNPLPAPFASSSQMRLPGQLSK
jgi:hypothetical protein